MLKTLGLAFLVLTVLACPARAETLRVGIGGAAPFVMWKDLPEPQGIAVDLWDAVASQLGVEFNIVHVTNYKQGLQDLQDGKIDVLVGNLTITESRAHQADFTEPYYYSEMGILTSNVPPTLLQRVEGLFNQSLLVTVGLSIAVLFAAGCLLWLLERKHNAGQFPADFKAGVANGMWAMLVTFTTVGYGDRAPVTNAGRWLTGVWMIVATVSVSGLTAVLASAITLSGINNTIRGPESLASHRVAVIAETTSVAYAHQLKADETTFKTVVEAVQNLESQQVDAVLFDEPVLAYYVLQHPDEPLRMIPTGFGSEHFGFAVHLGSPLRHRLNLVLLRLTESGQLQQIEDKWLGPAVQ